MKHFLTLIALIFVLPLSAQTVGDGLEEMGKMQITLDGQSYEMLGLRMTEKDRHTVELSTIANFKTITATAMSIKDGKATSPVVTVQIGPYVNDDLPEIGSFEWYNGKEIIAANVDTGMRVSLSEVAFGEDGTLSFSFEGQAVLADRSSGMMVPIEGAMPMPVSGSYSGRIVEDN